MRFSQLRSYGRRSSLFLPFPSFFFFSPSFLLFPQFSLPFFIFSPISNFFISPAPGSEQNRKKYTPGIISYFFLLVSYILSNQFRRVLPVILEDNTDDISSHDTSLNDKNTHEWVSKGNSNLSLIFLYTYVVLPIFRKHIGF